MNGKVVYETPLGDRFLFFEEDRFTVVRNDTAESHGYQFQFPWESDFRKTDFEESP